MKLSGTLRNNGYRVVSECGACVSLVCRLYTGILGILAEVLNNVRHLPLFIFSCWISRCCTANETATTNPLTKP